jgi:acetylserotonin N-methyltransferase
VRHVPLPAELPESPIEAIALGGNQQTGIAMAIRIGLFTHLRDEPQTLEQIIASLETSPRAVEAIVAVAASSGLLEVRDGRYALTPLARAYVLHDSPCFVAPILPLFFDGYAFPGASDAERESLRAVLRDVDRGRPEWIDGEVPDPDGQCATMHAHNLPGAIGMAHCGAFNGDERMLDVGGGAGTLSIALAAAHPRIACTVMDLPPVTNVAGRYIAEYGFSDRIATVGCDMFRQAWPRGHDGVLFSSIFHDWNAARCTELARRAHESLPPRGRIFVHEILLDEARTGPLVAALYSLELLSQGEGKQYTGSELSAILRAAGFDDVKITPTAAHFSLVSATRT